MLSIHLLGRPRAQHGESILPHPRGRKAWALFAYLVLAERPHSREHLASLLFAEANDPLRTLRWNLVELRKLLGAADILRGDRIFLSVPSSVYVDVRVLTSGVWLDASAVPGLGQELLAGMDFPASPGFEAWLLNERRRLMVASEAALREAALVRLSTGHPDHAVALAARLVAIDPLNEHSQALLVRSYVAAGDEQAGARQLAACVDLFRRELGTDPGPAVTAALRAGGRAWRSVPARGVAAGRAQLEAGLAALRAGVLDAALECLSRAAAEADAAEDRALKAEAMFEVGSALVHSGRNRHEEGAGVLHEVLPLAESLGDTRLQAATARELAWVELLAARYQRCETWLRRALTLAAGDDRETAAALWMRGMALTEVARYADSLDSLRKAADLADRAGDVRAAGITRALIGKCHVIRGELDEGRPYLEQSLESLRSAGWTWLLPWPEAYLGELELLAGHLDYAEGLLEHAFALASQISDPCFQCKSEATLGLLMAARGDVDGALEHLESARMWLIRTPDHTWSLAYALDAACLVGAHRGLGDAAGWIDDLEDLAGRSGMREFVARAYLHRYNLTRDAAALDSARALAADIDNPRLSALVREPDLARA